MAVVRAFKGLRPTKELAAKVASLPFDVMTSAEAREIVKGNEYSFLHVTKAEVDLDPSIDIYDSRVYEKARDNLYGMVERGILVQDEKPCYYIYAITMNGRTQTGITACVSIDEYMDGTIKKHEMTRADKEEDRIRHVDKCNANSGPIFLTYRSNPIIGDIINGWKVSHAPAYDFTADDGIQHTAWIVDDDAVIGKLNEEFAAVPALYIADGHHRSASAVKVGLKRRAENPGYAPDAEFNFYLSVIFPDDELRIMDYNRVVRDLNGYSVQGFLDELEKSFICTVLEGRQKCKPVDRHCFGMYLNGDWYSLSYKKHVDENNTIDALDVSILQNEVLDTLLGINDPRSDKRIDFIGGIRGMEELEKRVDSGEMAVAFSMYPPSMEELLRVADEGKIMPPKSTWFEPKLRSGLFVHLLS